MEYGLIGEKLGHSFSKEIHNSLGNYLYELKEIPPEDLKDFICSKNFKAINVTIPYKETVIPFLDEISDSAREIGAVNTIVNKNGKLYGFNTDFLGFKELIISEGIELKDKKVLILGSGGTSKTANAVAMSLGAKEIYRVSRCGGENLITYEDAYLYHTNADIIINTTPCGMYPNIGETAVDITRFSNLSGVVDVVYNPLNSALVVEAKSRGIKAVGGLLMLVAQAFFASEMFSGEKLDKLKMTEIFSKLLKKKENIVLIGMPGSGKTTIGKALARELGCGFIDTDEEIIKQEGISIPEIFNTLGEMKFREIESEVIKKVSLNQGFVIATGGGAILNPININLLKENGKVVFLNKKIEDLITTPDRPLSSNLEDLKKRYDERYDIYVSSADYIINCTNDAKENVKNIKEVIFGENFSD